MADLTLRQSTNAVHFIQKFGAGKSAWRFVKAAFALSAPKPAFRHVLITLASYADENGFCFPSHDRLLLDTGYGTKTTIVGALAYWKKTGVLTWDKGWGNAHGRRSNRYRFNLDAMLALKKNNHTGGDEQTPSPSFLVIRSKIPHAWRNRADVTTVRRLFAFSGSMSVMEIYRQLSWRGPPGSALM